jgi:hypothetical protein
MLLSIGPFHLYLTFCRTSKSGSFSFAIHFLPSSHRHLDINIFWQQDTHQSMMKSQTYQAWVLAMSLTQIFHQSANVANYCGSNYKDAIVLCNITCPSGLGYNKMSEENECPLIPPAKCYMVKMSIFIIGIF